jgi:GAF domain
MFLCEGNIVRPVAALGVPTALVDYDKQRGTFQPSAGGGLERVIRTKQVIRIADFASEHASNPVVRLGGARSYIAVPMLKENELIGAIVIYRQEVRPFSDKQIELVSNFSRSSAVRPATSIPLSRRQAGLGLGRCEPPQPSAARLARRPGHRLHRHLARIHGGAAVRHATIRPTALYAGYCDAERCSIGANYGAWDRGWTNSC